MYPPPHHQSKDIQKMIAIIRQFPFGMIVSARDNVPFVTHIPIMYNEVSGKLIAHIDRQNPQVNTLKDGAKVTAIFKGPDAYISPSVYTTKQLPTWNYLIVHLKGAIKNITDTTKVKQSIIDMTAFLEGEKPLYVLDNDNRSMDRLTPYIQAFEIDITDWEGKFKLSQDKNAQDFENAKQALIKKSREDISGFINTMYKQKR